MHEMKIYLNKDVKFLKGIKKKKLKYKINYFINLCDLLL